MINTKLPTTPEGWKILSGRFINAVMMTHAPGIAIIGVFKLAIASFLVLA